MLNKAQQFRLWFATILIGKQTYAISKTKQRVLNGGSMINTLAQRLPSNFRKSTDLFEYPSFTYSLAKMFDLFGHLQGYRYSHTEEEADTKALQRDYEIALSELKKVLEDYGQTTKSR